MTSAEGAAPPDQPEQDLGGPSDLPHTRLSHILDGAVTRIGDAASWLWIVLVGVIVLNVTLRYLFAEGRIELEELQWHLYAVGFLIGLSYAAVSDVHVRVDVLYLGFRLKTKAWIELFGLCLFLLPFIALVVIYAVPFIERSRDLQEVSDAPSGLPFCLSLGAESALCFPMRWHIKLMLLVGFLLLLVTAISRLSRVTACLFGWPASWPPRRRRQDRG